MSDDIEKACERWIAGDDHNRFDHGTRPLTFEQRTASLTAIVREQVGLIQSRLTASQELHESARERIDALEAALVEALEYFRIYDLWPYRPIGTAGLQSWCERTRKLVTP